MAKSPAQEINDAKLRVHGAVQQIFYNELGMNRGSLKEKMTEIVDKEIEKQVGARLGSDVEKRLRGILSQMIYGKWRADELNNKVTRIVEEEIRKYIAERVKTILDGSLKVEIKMPEAYGQF